MLVLLLLLARDAFIRMNRHALAMMFVRLGTLTPNHVRVLPAVVFQFHLEERWGMDVQTRRDISRMVEDRGQVTLECL